MRELRGVVAKGIEVTHVNARLEEAGRRLEARAEERATRATVLDEVVAPVTSTMVALASGRRYEIDAGDDADRVTIRGRGGEIVLRIEVTDKGPVLRFSGADLELSAAGRLHLSARDVSVEAAGELALSAGGAPREQVGGDRHTIVAGDERLDAARVELQANSGGVAVRAAQRISLDGEHIGLNDDPAPQPFPWSTIAEDPVGPRT
jgi:hypothetical protein